MLSQFEHAPCGFISLDHQSYITDVNATFLEWTGFTKQIIGQHFDSLLSAANKMMFHSYFYPTINIHGQVDELYINFRHATGELMPYLLNAKRFGTGVDERIDCVFMQMKKRIDYELELRATKEQLQDAYRAKELAFNRLEEIYATIEQKQAELLEINSGLVKVTNTDKLTGLSNRKYFQEKMEESIQAFMENGTPLSILILDIDYFKKVNDTYGHPVGDKVLIRLAQLMERTAREGDIPCRYGGEEFVVILPSTSAEVAIELGKQYNVAVQQETWPEIGNLTISVGAATLKENETDEELLDRADRALYYSKQNGRNRVTHFNEVVQFQ